jgi:lysozyme family protein
VNVPETRFSICMPFVLAMECPFPNNWSDPRNFSNTPHDPGGATMCGITQNNFSSYLASIGQPYEDVRSISIHQGWDIYEFDYWLPHSPQLPTGLDLSYFDTCVNSGAGGANQILQAALQIGVDGVWGPVTAAAIGRITNVAATIEAFCGARARYYRRLRNFVYFGRGWIRRALAIQNDSLAMLTSTSGLMVEREFVRTAKAYPEAI